MIRPARSYVTISRADTPLHPVRSAKISVAPLPFDLPPSDRSETAPHCAIYSGPRRARRMSLDVLALFESAVAELRDEGVL